MAHLYIYIKHDTKFWQTSKLHVSPFLFQTAYRETDKVNSFIRQVLALPFLPGEHIRPAFRFLRSKTTSPQLLSLMDYIDRTWIQSSIWIPDSWNMYLQSIRTNNDVEGWHRHINLKAQNVKVYICTHVHFEVKHGIPTLNYKNHRAFSADVI